MPAIPELMSKIWDGDDNEYFTFIDMNRVEYNANICAKYAGVGTADFLVTTREGQFRYDEAQKLENLIKAIGAKLGVAISTESNWSYNRTVSYVDFERWESNIWNLYTALGGVGNRIQAGKVLVNYHTTLFASEWQGTGPYYMDLEMPAIYSDTEALAFVSHTADVLQRQDEYNATLRVIPNGDRVVRVYALGIKPKTNIPMTLAVGGLQMHKEISLPASSWSGSGPWTQNVSVPQGATDAVIGQWEGMTAEAVEQMLDARLHVSAINGTTITVRAIGVKPTVTLNPTLLYDVSNVE